MCSERTFNLIKEIRQIQFCNCCKTFDGLSEQLIWLENTKPGNFGLPCIAAFITDPMMHESGEVNNITFFDVRFYLN